MVLLLIIVLLCVLYFTGVLHFRWINNENYSACRDMEGTDGTQAEMPDVLKNVTVLNPYIYPYSAVQDISYVDTGKSKSLKSEPDHIPSM